MGRNLLLFCTLLALAACDSVVTQPGLDGPRQVMVPGTETFDAGGMSGPLAVELAAARAGTARYQNIDAALADGFEDIDVYVPGMGHHYLNPARLDATFDPAEPELLVYSQEPNGRMRLVAVEYAIPTSMASQPPEAFTGQGDTWDENTDFGLWTLHAWVWLHNPDGVFGELNPRLL
jgi:hypothetical protein